MRRILILVAVGLTLPFPAARGESILVFAAASMAAPIAAAGELFAAQSGHQITLSTAGTATLVRQLKAGAPAAVLITADRMWMDEAIAAETVIAETIAVIASNRLSLAAPARDNPARLALSAEPFAARLGSGRFAMADPNYVPAGRYGRQALSKLGLWPLVASRQLRTDNVRAALAFIARGEVPLGIVYRTDVLAEENVTEVAVLPAESHDKIEYLAAVTSNGDKNARSFVAFLRSDPAQSVLTRFGFLRPFARSSDR